MTDTAPEPTAAYRGPDPVDTAEEFARKVDRQERRRRYQLQRELQRQDHDLTSQRVWATVVATVILSALIAFIVYSVTSEHARERIAHEQAKQGKVTVWCYADPNSDRGTSTVTGTPDQVRNFCPDRLGP